MNGQKILRQIERLEERRATERKSHEKMVRYIHDDYRELYGAAPGEVILLCDVAKLVVKIVRAMLAKPKGRKPKIKRKRGKGKKK